MYAVFISEQSVRAGKRASFSFIFVCFHKLQQYEPVASVISCPGFSYSEMHLKGCSQIIEKKCVILSPGLVMRNLPARWGKEADLRFVPFRHFSALKEITKFDADWWRAINVTQNRKQGFKRVVVLPRANLQHELSTWLACFTAEAKKSSAKRHSLLVSEALTRALRSVRNAPSKGVQY